MTLNEALRTESGYEAVEPRGKMRYAIARRRAGSGPAYRSLLKSVQFIDGRGWPPAAPVAQNGSSAITIAPLSLNSLGFGTTKARLLLATGAAPLAMTSNCGEAANVELLASTSRRCVPCNAKSFGILRDHRTRRKPQYCHRPRRRALAQNPRWQDKPPFEGLVGNFVLRR